VLDVELAADSRIRISVFIMKNQLLSPLKLFLFIICTVSVSPLIAGVFITRRFGIDRPFFQGSSQLLSIVPFRIGVYLRAAFYKNTCNNVDREINIGFMTLLSHSDVDIHKNTYIGGQCNIVSGSEPSSYQVDRSRKPSPSD